MLWNKMFSNTLSKISALALSGALLAALTPSASWAMEGEDREHSAVVRRPIKDVLSYTFSFFGPKELGRLALISKQWKEISESDVLWKRFGTESKKEFAEFMNSTAINILNTLPNTTHEIGIAYGSGPYFTELGTKMKGASFDECIMTVELPTDQNTVIRFHDLPEKITSLGPKRIYGVTKLPGTNSALQGTAIHVDMEKCKSLLAGRYMTIWEILGDDLKFFEIKQGALEDMIFFRDLGV